jgi:hypothetical protein
MMSLHLLMIATPQFIQPMSDHLIRYACFLRPPGIVWTGPERYINPHAAILQTQDAQARHQAMVHGVANGAACAPNQWRTGPRTAAQVEEAKREQVEQVFTQMNSGADLENVEPGQCTACRASGGLTLFFDAQTRW